MSLVKLAVSKKDVAAYNKQYKEKAGISPYIAPVAGGLTGLGVGLLADKMINGKIIKLTPGLLSAGVIGGWASNHVRVHNKIDKKLRTKIVPE